MFVFSLKAASLLSYELKIDDRDALDTENAMTPKSIKKIAPIFSDEVPPDISPYPTVVIVVIVK